eukprot:CCRYP_020755-RA/>CCRYP_020755-RA protein AED:0.32 eAED:0.37 QI:0/-1/0/1/-1/1/1/0/518
MSDDERKAERKKKKKKHKDRDGEHKSKKSSRKEATAAAAAGETTDGEEDRELAHQRVRSKQNGEKSSSRRKRSESDSDDERKPAARSNRAVEAVDRLGSRRRHKARNDHEHPGTKPAATTDEEIENSRHSNRASLEGAKNETERRNGDNGQRNGDDDVIEAHTDVYYPNLEADAEVMAHINQDGAVQVDESGGIQAFVAETIEIDGDNVGIIKSDAEIELEEKRKYSKWFLGAVLAIIVVVVAIAVPLTLKYGKGGTRVQLNIVTQAPTDVPSMMPSISPSSMPSSERFMEITNKLYPLSGEALYDQGSPQYLAAMWMADNDPMRMDLDDAGFEQRYIMALFYYAMDGPSWVEQYGWLSEESECYWFGIDGTSPGCGSEESGGCIPRTDFKGSYNKVCRLAFGRLNNLYGQFPSELSYLDEMRYVEIQTDYLYGTIPSSLGTNWTKLTAFLVGQNFLGGSFPNTFKDNALLGTISIDFVTHLRSQTFLAQSNLDIRLRAFKEQSSNCVNTVRRLCMRS